MKSLYDFIVKPLGDKYKNTVKIAGKDVVINTKIENWKFVNRLAKVVETPLAFKSGIKKGDIVVIHQNVFRTFYDMRGEKKKSRSYFKNDLYFCGLDQVYLYKNKNGWNTVGDRCFITPIKSNDSLTLDKERELVGILKYGNKSLEALEINSGDIVGYTPNGEWEFLVEGKRLYCMKSNDIVIKYEHQGDEEEYNPSWAASS
jgi:co-chaperonin GroES (HSP10)